VSGLFGFLAGFVSGWAARSSVDSSHGLAVRTMDALYASRARLGRWLAVEHERIADLLAEVRARYDQPDAQAQQDSAPDKGAAEGTL
jgi:hypothetical protein